jgi:lipopolysaccharide biosynthesis regulator YciM
LPCSLLTIKHQELLPDLDSEELQHLNLLLAEGRAFLESGSYEPAAGKFRQLLAHHPFHVQALEGLAEAHDKLRQPSAAEECRHRLEVAREHALV